MLILNPPALYPDPVWGFQTMRSLQNGHGFNVLASVDTNDISKTNYSFLAWWSPGQYLLPYMFIRCFNFNIGIAVSLVITICSLSGIFGFYAFFKKIGFSPLTSALSIAFIACQLAFVAPYYHYNGGEVLLFGFSGWFLYGCSYYSKAGIFQAIFVLLTGIIGFVCKSSFLWMYFSGILFLWIKISYHKPIRLWVGNALYTGIPALLSLVAIYGGYLSKGNTPASGSNGFAFASNAFSFPVAAPLLSGFSIDDMVQGVTSYPAAVVLLLALLSVILFAYIIKIIPYNDYKLVLTIFYIVCTIFYCINFLRQADISFEARHLRLIGIMITPGIIYLVSKSGKLYKVFFGLLCLFIFYQSCQDFVVGQKDNQSGARGNTGIAQISIDQPALTAVIAIDKQQRNAIFVFVSPDISLEVMNNRTIIFDPLDDGLTPPGHLNIFRGHAGPLYLVLPQLYQGTSAAIYLKNFPGYHNFKLKHLSKDYLLYTAI